MALTQITGPYPIFTDLDGTPLDDGYLYIGEANEDPVTNPVQVFFDANLTIPATQPIRTNNGYAYRNGTPALIYTAGAFSITIRNKRDEFVLYSPVGYGFDPAAVSASVVKNDFTGNGIQVAFVLSASPSTILATSVFINGVYQEKDSYTLSGNTITFSVAPPLSSSIEIISNETGIINSGNANDISYTLPAAGATLQSVQTKLEQYVSVKDFGAVCDGVTDDTAAVQAAIDYCLSNAPGAASTLMINGVCRLTSSLKLDIAIDDITNRLIIYGDGERAGFYTSTNVNMFSTNFPGTTDPVSGNVTFENIVFETSSNLSNSFVLNGGKFLRMNFIGCEFYKIRCLSSAIYTQSYRFERCRVRSTTDRFFESAGMYDIHAQIDGKFCVTGFRSLDTTRGINEASFTECVWEGNTGALIECTGANGLVVANNYIEFNSAIGCNFALGSMTNTAITVQGNIFVQAPAQSTDPNFYDIDWGLTTNGTSIGNYCNGKLHKGLSATNCVSIGDSFFGAINSPNIRKVNAATRFGAAQDVWTDSANQINKSATGNFAFGAATESTVRLTVRGADQTSSNFAGAFLDSTGLPIAAFRNDRLIQVPALSNYANDAAAAAGGIPVGYLYRNGSVVQVRVT